VRHSPTEEGEKHAVARAVGDAAMRGSWRGLIAGVENEAGSLSPGLLSPTVTVAVAEHAAEVLPVR